MRRAERWLPLLLVLALIAACIPAAAATNVRTVSKMRTVELFNADGLTITAGGDVREEFTLGKNRKVISYHVPLTFVNTTEEKLEIDFLHTILNGRYIGWDLTDTFCTLSPGETRQTALNLSCSVLEAYGVTALDQIGSLELTVRIIYPDGSRRENGKISLSAKLLGQSPRKAKPVPCAEEIAPQTLFEGDGLTVWTDGLTPDGKALSLCLTSARAEPVQVSVQDIIVNGWQITLADTLFADPGGFTGTLLKFGDDIPDYTGLASIAFDLNPMYRDGQVWLETGQEEYPSLYDEPVHISLEPAHPAEISEPEGWIPAAELDGLQILYRGGFSLSKSYVNLPLMFINKSEKRVWLECCSGTILINGQPVALYSFFDGLTWVSPGAKLTATVCVLNKQLKSAGIKWNEVRSVDFDFIPYPENPNMLRDTDSEPRPIPVHIDFD